LLKEHAELEGLLDIDDITRAAKDAEDLHLERKALTATRLTTCSCYLK
jgi:hypothetical protein